MSWINLKQIILGIAGTTAQKFTLATPDTPDGTAKLSRGVPGSLTQDILSIDLSGYMSAEVTPPATDNTKKIASTAWAKLGFVALYATNGYLKLPSWLGGLIFQWGTNSITSAGDNGITLPLAWSGQMLYGGGTVPSGLVGYQAIVRPYIGVAPLTAILIGCWQSPTVRADASVNWFCVGF